MSQVLFVKSGGYYETPAIAVAQAIYEATADEVKQFIKIDMSFKFDFVEGEHRVYMANHIPGASLLYRKIDFKRLITGIEKYGFAYYGCVVDATAVVTHVEVFNKATYVGYDQTSKNFIDLITGMRIDGDNIVPIIYGIKMTDGVYSTYLSPMARADGRLGDGEDEFNQLDDLTVVYADDGLAIRDKFIDIQFTNTIKHFRNQDLITGYAVFAKCGEVVELDIFKNKPYITEEFRNAFELIVDSNFEYVVDGSKILLTMPETHQQGYLCVSLNTQPIHMDAASREIKETLHFDFTVSAI